MTDVSSRISELVWRTDNRSAIKGLEQIAKKSTETKDSIKANAEQESLSMDKVREHTSMLRDSMMGLAGMVGLGGVAFGIKDLITGGMSLQAQQSQLAIALHATGQEAGGTADQLERMAESLSTHGGFETTKNLSALTAFVRETHSATEAQKLLALSTNIARGRNMDLATAQQTVARAYTGSVGRLQQLLGPMVAAKEASVGLSIAHQKEMAAIQTQAAFMRGPMKTAYVQQQMIADHITAQQAALAQMTDKHTTAQQVLALATKEFANSTDAYSRTTQGQMSNLDNSVHNLTDNLGKALLPTMDKLVAVGVKVSEFLAHNKTEVLVVSLALAGLAAAWGAVKVAVVVWRTTMEVANAVQIASIALMDGMQQAIYAAAVAVEVLGGAWKVFMMSTIAGIVIVGLIEIVTHWKQVKEAAVDAWHWVEHAAQDAFSWIKQNWPLIAGILLAPFTGGISIIVGLFHNQLLGGAEAVINGIKNFFVGLWHDIVSGAKWAVHEAKSILDTLGFGGNGIASYINPVGLAGHIGHFLGGLLSGGGVVPQHFAAGGQVEAARYLAVGGPSGTDTVPAWLTPDEGVVSTQGMAGIGGEQGLSMINSGQTGLGGLGGGLGGRIMVTPQTEVTVQLDRQVLGRALIQWALSESARGVYGGGIGGSLVTGAPGLPA